MTSAIHIYVTGLVQGVYYRASCLEEARRLGLKGWVKNLPDGRVEAYATGEPAALDALVAWCKKGSPASKVNSVQASKEEVDSGLHNFKILY